jgi:hypothetical protein
MWIWTWGFRRCREVRESLREVMSTPRELSSEAWDGWAHDRPRKGTTGGFLGCISYCIDYLNASSLMALFLTLTDVNVGKNVNSFSAQFQKHCSFKLIAHLPDMLFLTTANNGFGQD